jgi:hypothetical protein
VVFDPVGKREEFLDGQLTDLPGADSEVVGEEPEQF